MVYADTFFLHGHIYTLNASQPVAETLAVRDGRILAVGMDDDFADLRGPGTQIVDLERQTVIPGFHDAHCHILLLGLNLIELNTHGKLDRTDSGESGGASGPDSNRSVDSRRRI